MSLIRIVASSLLLSCIVAAVVAMPQQKPKGADCDTKLKVMDSSVANMLLLSNPDLRPFADVEDLDENYCSQFMGWVRSISGYRSCLKAFQNTVFGIVVSNMKRNYKRFCLDEAEKENIVKHSQCFIEENKVQLGGVGHKLTGLVEYVADRPNPDDMIPGLCCGFHLLSKSIFDHVEQVCNTTTGARGMSTGTFTKMIVDANVAEALDIMCGNFGSLEICNAKSEALVQELKGVIDSSNKVYDHTAFVALLRFIKKMDSAVNVQ